MLGPKVIVLMTLSLFPCEDDDLPTLVRESLEHPASFLGGAYTGFLCANLSKNLA
jgi:hypothetical protein